MFTTITNHTSQTEEKINKTPAFPHAFEVKFDPRVKRLLANLSSDTPWGDRQIAARKLGYLRDENALQGLLAALQIDNFWMVRCSIIQALEMIGQPEAIPVLSEVAIQDDFQVVRSYAAKAVERLS